MHPLPAKFYPIAPDYQAAAHYMKSGVRFLQIRLKELNHTEIKTQLSQAIKLAKEYHAQLVINDYWQYALDLQADWIHLGQEDLQTADLKAIRNANIKFGLSTHDLDELNTAIQTSPNYIALGPIYFTKLKAMKWEPQGLEKIKIWQEKCAAIPLVAIGGITLERADLVLQAGADCVSFVTDITHHQMPEKRLKAWIKAYVWSLDVVA